MLRIRYTDPVRLGERAEFPSAEPLGSGIENPRVGGSAALRARYFELAAEQLGEVGGGLGASHQVALDLVAAQEAEELGLSGGLDAFGDHFEIEGVGEGDDGGDDRHLLRIFGHIVDERAIDLEGVEGQAAEVAERGVAGAEV